MARRLGLDLVHDPLSRLKWSGGLVQHRDLVAQTAAVPWLCAMVRVTALVGGLGQFSRIDEGDVSYAMGPFHGLSGGLCQSGGGRSLVAP